MNDLISRQAAIDGIMQFMPEEEADMSTTEQVNYSAWVSALSCVKTFVRTMPSAQPEPRWIPCSERLPEEKERSYWVCLETGGQCQCRWTNDMYGLGANKWSKWGWHIMDKPQYSKIVAWMPLPEPYREDIE